MTDHHEHDLAVAMPLDDLRQIALRVADEFRALPAGDIIPADVRARFITLRAALFQRGIYDPVLVRFDSSTVAHASTPEIGEQLAAVAESLVVVPAT
jgi:hypothetical protein